MLGRSTHILGIARRVEEHSYRWNVDIYIPTVGNVDVYRVVRSRMGGVHDDRRSLQGTFTTATVSFIREYSRP